MTDNLMSRMNKAGSIKTSSILSESTFFNLKDATSTDLPILNIAFSGDLKGGYSSGLTILAGASRTFKTLLGLYCMKAYFDKYPDAIALFYDSEFGATDAYMKQIGIDMSRVIHIPIEHIEQLKFDIAQRYEEIKRGDHVFTLVDSLGNLASKKEIEDAMKENAAADMTRAKAIRSLLRIITPNLTTKDIPCIMINHVYQTLELYAKTVIPGGTAVMYAANQIFVISRSQVKDTKDGPITGYHFTITVEKSRFVEERSKLEILVRKDSGISKWSGLFELAKESGHVVAVTAQSYRSLDPETGQIFHDKIAIKKTFCEEFWTPIMESESFNKFIHNKFKLTGKSLGFQTEEDE